MTYIWDIFVLTQLNVATTKKHGWHKSFNWSYKMVSHLRHGEMTFFSSLFLTLYVSQRNFRCKNTFAFICFTVDSFYPNFASNSIVFFFFFFQEKIHFSESACSYSNTRVIKVWHWEIILLYLTFRKIYSTVFFYIIYFYYTNTRENWEFLFYDATFFYISSYLMLLCMICST